MEGGLHSTSPSKLLALSLRQEQPNRWKGFAVVGIRNPAAQQAFPLCVSSSPPASAMGISSGESKAEIAEWGEADL